MKWAIPAAVFVASIYSGCNALDSAANAGHYEVRVDTPMYRYGPAQSFGPDFSLKQGQHVILMRKDYGYSRIMTDENQTGYVATEDIMPMAPQKIAAISPAASSGSGSGLGRTNANHYPGVPANWQSRTVKPSDGRGGRFAGPVIPSDGLFHDGELPPLPENAAGGPIKPGTPKPEFRHDKPKPSFRVNIPTPSAEPAPAPSADPPSPAFR